MSFFNPWLWFGLISVGAPVWLHLRRRLDRKAKVFPALRFLDDAPVARQAPLSLRDVLLFLLRLLAVGLIAAAFAWPYRPERQEAAVSVSRVYILDHTLSTQAGGSFERDRNAVIKELANLGTSTQAAVVELTAQPRTVVNFSDSPEVAREKLKALPVSYQRGPYLAAFRMAQTLLERALGQKREIVFYGDSQTNQWAENANTLGFLRDVDVRMGRMAETKSLDNAAVTAPSVQRVFLGSRSQVQCKGMMQHSGQPGRATVVVEVNGQEILRNPFDLDRQAVNQPIAALWEGHPTGWIEGRIYLEHGPDALPADDQIWFAAPPVTEGKVAVLGRSPFVRAALSEPVSRGHWTSQVIDPAKLEPLATLPPGGDADVLVIEASYLQSAAVRAGVERYLSTGRGVLIQVDRITPIVRESLRKLGFEASEPVVPGALERIGSLNLNHRLLAPFASPDLGNILAVDFPKHRQVSAVRGNPLMFTEGGDALVLEGTQGAGRILVTTFRFDREDTNWVLEPTFVPFLDLALQYLRQDSARVAWLDPGELWTVTLPPGESAQKLVVHQAGKVISETPVGADRIAHVRLPQQPGLYKVTYDDRPGIERIALVNARPEESDLNFVKETPAALAAWKLPSSTATIEMLQAVAGPSRQQRAHYRQRYWWWLVLGALSLLTIENLFLFRRAWSL